MKKSMRVFIVVICALAVVGLTAIIVFNAVRDAQYRTYGLKIDAFDNRLSGFVSSYETSGMSEQTKNTILDFIAGIPGSVREQNNIVIADLAGNIVYQYNDKYVPVDAGKLNIAWNTQYALMSDEKTGTNHWLYVRYMNDYPMSSDSTDSAQIGEIKYSADIHDVLQIIDHQSPQDVVAYVSIYQVKCSNADQYILWFRDHAADSTIYESLQDNIDTAAYNGFIITGTLMIVAYWLLLPIWVFLDARRRQTQPLPWALLVLLTNVVGLIVYWIVQSQNGKVAPAPACPACGKPVKKAYPYCPWCAAPLVKACKACGKTLEPGWTACPWCGKPIE